MPVPKTPFDPIPNTRSTPVGPPPLKGLRVLDLSRVVAGPYRGQLLADLGAEEVEVESPEGDENSRWAPRTGDGTSCNFASVNRGQRGITLNLKSPAAQPVLAALVKMADVVIQSFLPATAPKPGVDAHSIRAINHRVIHFSLSGYGKEGAMANRPGDDLMMQAFSGMMSTTGMKGGLPVCLGVSLIDMSTGLTAFGGVMSALYSRDRTGTPIVVAYRQRRMLLQSS